MDRYSVNLSPRIVAALRRQAAAAVPAECCGALIGRAQHRHVEVRTVIPVENAATEHSRYLIDADSVLRLERQCACAGFQVLGFYHSHPTASAEPSSLDVELAFPGYVYLIVDAERGAVRCWRLRDDRSGFTELGVTLLAGAA